ncbi:MAG: hypothetical protein ACR2P7_06985, partial [bacterium]
TIRAKKRPERFFASGSEPAGRVSGRYEQKNARSVFSRAEASPKGEYQDDTRNDGEERLKPIAKSRTLRAA